MGSKQEIINKIYYDRAGYGSKATTLKDAREKDPTIKMADVEQFFKQNVEVKKRPTKYNSFIAPHNRHTYQIDLTFFRREDFDKPQKYYMALTCIDVLSKYAVAIPLENKDASTIINKMPEILRRMGGKANLYSATMKVH